MSEADEARAAVERCWQEQEELALRLGDAVPGYVEAIRRTRAHHEAEGTFPDRDLQQLINHHREAMTEALNRFVEGRLQLRLALVRLRLAEGRPLADIAKDWGVSRQYIWKLARKGRFITTGNDSTSTGPSDDAPGT